MILWVEIPILGDTEENPAYVTKLKKLAKDSGLNEDMPAAYLASDLVVSTTSSQPEAFDRIAIEAQTMGRPVVASAQGGSLEAVLPDKTGWLVEAENSAALSTALREALIDPEKRKTLGANGIEWVQDNFTTKKMCHATLSPYKQILDTSK